MQEEKLHLINKIFNNKKIRTIWNSEEAKFYVSIVDIVGILADSKEPRKYWNWLKNKMLKEEKFEVSSIIRHFKLKALDGKYRVTDVCDIEGMFRIIESIPSKNAEPIKRWLAKLGKERIDETFDPSITIQRAINLYRSKGYDEAWIRKRIKALQDRKTLTDIWHDAGIVKQQDFALLTDEIYKTWSGMSAKEYKQFKGLKKENLRDNMDNIELILTDLSEEAAKLIAIKKNPQGLNESLLVARLGGNVAKVARENLENNLKELIITSENKMVEQIEKQ